MVISLLKKDHLSRDLRSVVTSSNNELNGSADAPTQLSRPVACLWGAGCHGFCNYLAKITPTAEFVAGNQEVRRCHDFCSLKAQQKPRQPVGRESSFSSNALDEMTISERVFGVLFKIIEVQL